MKQRDAKGRFSKVVKGYKAFDLVDGKLMCREMVYKIGKTYKHEGKIQLYKSGFHFCINIASVYNHYTFGCVICEVEATGEVIHGDEKSVTNSIKIIRQLDEETAKANSGNRNSGYMNSGRRNSGNRNSGDWNSGYMNSGDWNSGNWNSCDGETGYFNSQAPDTINVFNKKCDRKVWETAKKPAFIFFSLTEWVRFSEMNEQEKKENPQAETTNGYLKKLEYKEAWAKSYAKATAKDIKFLKALPNFDANVFYEITGLEVK